jgi:ribose transport system ATP-binding protein
MIQDLTVPALSVRHLSKTFAGTPALRDVSVDVMPGEVRALAGQNGSGKSVFIKLLAGYFTPDPGAEVEVGGEHLVLGKLGAAEQCGVRFVHQDLGLVETLDVVDNLALGRGYQLRRGGLINWKAERRAANAAMERVGYDLDVSRLAGDLTASQRTAIAVARALLPRKSESRLLVLDEPTANLPDSEAQEVFALVRKVQESGVAVLFVSHHLNEVFEMSESVTVFRDGQHITTAPTSELDEQRLIRHMIGRSPVSFEPRAPREVGEAVLEVDGLAAGPLRSISFTAHAGEIVGIAGITGSGRESVSEAIFGSLDRSAGSVRLLGEEVPAGRPDVSKRMGLGLVPAERIRNAAFVDHTVRENLSIADLRSLTSAGLVSGAREKRESQDWTTRLTVRPAEPERALNSLSGGNQQKVMIARWLRLQPKVLVLDEPTQGVDVVSKAEIHALVKAEADRGTAVVLVSTDDGELVSLSDRVIVLADGVQGSELTSDQLDLDSMAYATAGVERDVSGEDTELTDHAVAATGRNSA